MEGNLTVLAGILHREVLASPASLKSVLYVPYHSKVTFEPLSSEQRVHMNVTEKPAFKPWLQFYCSCFSQIMMIANTN